MESHPPGSIYSAIALVVLLIVFGAFFVAAEIALISLRESQIKQMATRGKRGAMVAKVAANPNRLLAALQVGSRMHFRIQLMPFFTFPYPGRYVPDGPRMKVLVG